jgi:hypothetical protein
MSEIPESELISHVAGEGANDSDFPAAAAPPSDKGGKSKEEIYLELAKLAQQSFEHRRTYEWKAAFGLWAAIGLVTYFAVEHPAVLTSWTVGVIGAIYILLSVCWFFVWQVPTRRAFEQDKAWKHFYMHKAEGLTPERPTEVTWREMLTGIRHLPWTYGQAVVTVLFLAGSFFVLLAARSPGLTDESKVELKASGKSVEVTSKVLNK